MGERPIKAGHRVECRKQGPFFGKKGRVQDIFWGQAYVTFQSTSMMESVDCFQRV